MSSTALARVLCRHLCKRELEPVMQGLLVAITRQESANRKVVARMHKELQQLRDDNVLLHADNVTQRSKNQALDILRAKP
jgi:hypothetical protein